jgi:3-hydroxybutyryl-CoA dehydrogenase
MRILILGSEINYQDCQTKFGGRHDYRLAGSYQEVGAALPEADLVFDFQADPAFVEGHFAGFREPVFFNTTKVVLLELTKSSDKNLPRFGFNGMTGFVLLPVLEICLSHRGMMPALQAITQNLGTEFCVVDDRVGMVSPRIICMIINEAFNTAQKGTATREDIDLAMKLGTNYPYGPFEWCRRIGIREVYELLESVHEDTQDSRYKISPLLKKAYLQSL